MDFPENLKYTREHEWVRIDGGIATIGITDYAQGELGDVVFVELPAVGRALKLGETFGTIEAVKAVSDLFSPLTGSVTETNPALDKTPETINKDPYGDGWMIKLKFSDAGELSPLLTASAYQALIGK